MAQPFAGNLQSSGGDLWSSEVVGSVQVIRLAQLGASVIDLDPPEVDHVPVAAGVAGTSQSVSVKAVDAQGVASVTLLYRNNPANEYKRVLMRRVAGSDNYTVTLESTVDQRMIEYYFLVIDTGGNKVLSGFPYEPFTRTLTQQLAIESVPSENTGISEIEPPIPVQAVRDGETDNRPATTTSDSQSSSAVVWAVLGVLVLGALASAGGGGDSAAPSAGTVPVIFDIPVP